MATIDRNELKFDIIISTVSPDILFTEVNGLLKFLV